MSRRDLWWAGVAVVAGLAVGMFVRGTHGPLVSLGTAASAIPAAERALCVGGSAVGAGNEGLLDDCAVLLQAKDTLRGTATLNWSADTAITSWTGVTVSGTPQRVTRLNLDSSSLTGSIPAGLGELSALQQLRLSWNQLTGTIPPELGKLTQLSDLGLGGNQLTGTIPPELGSIGSTLTTLQISGPNPLPSGIGLTGSIPSALGNLSGLTYLWLNGNALTGSIPTRLGRLTNLTGLHLHNNQLSGAIPTQLGDLAALRELQLENNQLAGALPTQLGGLRSLRKVYLKGNTGLSGCVPSRLGEVRFNDVARLNLPDCTADTPTTPMTPVPTHTLTVTAPTGGSVSPGGTTTHDEFTEVTLTASWNDASHDFTGWGDACSESGTAVTCVLTMDADKTVSASFAALSADRCATTSAADCIRAVYRGAPADYAQVSEIPAEALIEPDARRRYQVERGQQVTVVTAAPLPTGYTRFYLERSPLGSPSPVSSSQLIQPVGTAYTFTITAAEGGSNLITFDLTAAKPNPLGRPGLKPLLGDVVVTTTFLVPTLRYDTLDTTGAAATAGSYAFLQTAGDATSAIGNFSLSARGSVELRVHPTDASGTSRTTFYDTVQVGDTFDYRTNGLDCGFRFKVTSIGSTASPRTFGVEQGGIHYGGRCGDFVDDPGAARDVEFVWGALPGAPVADGVRVMIPNEPAGEGTYRVHAGFPYVVDVPAGIRVSTPGLILLQYERGSGNDLPLTILPLVDAETAAVLTIDAETGREAERFDTTTAVDALFDQIIGSIRIVD